MPKVDYDDLSDPDCPKCPYDIIMDLARFVAVRKNIFIIVDGEYVKNENGSNRTLDQFLEYILGENTTLVHAYNANIQEQVEARLSELGWNIKRKRRWKK